MPRINVLPKNISELIAAGEVVERPASVVKELVENSIDAGATVITVEIKNGGITYIRITDNGCGITHDDVPKAFISHATSKVSTADDLNSIFTLGFRGEALASVAAVSRAQMFTKVADEQFGTSYIIEGSEQIQYEQAGCPDGTTIVVRDLFFNTPARMKFLKKDVSEANAVADVVDKLALSHPEISFRFIRDAKQTLLTPGDSRPLSAVYSVYGKDFAEGLLDVDYELDKIKVKGLVCKPLCARQSRSMQIFFLNGRYIKSGSCTAALENAYKNTMMVGKFPGCVLNIEVPLYSVDVNVHPTKTQVRFSDERKVFSAVYYAVKTALEQFDTRPQLDVTKAAQRAVPSGVQLNLAEDKTDKALQNQPAKPAPRADFWSQMPSSRFKSEQSSVSSPKSENPFIRGNDEPDLLAGYSENSVSLKAKGQDAERSCEKAEAIVSDEKDRQSGVVITQEDEEQPVIRFIGEAFKTYIIVEYNDRICLIDKHAAHERIIFNRLKLRRENEASQILLSPAVVLLGKSEYSISVENLNVFSECGFLVEDFGKDTLIVRECPMLIDAEDAGDIVSEIASNLLSGKIDTQSDKIDMILHTAACKAAIKAGGKQSPVELEALAKQVLNDDNVRYCPHGRPVLIELTKYELEKQFGRIQ